MEENKVREYRFYGRRKGKKLKPSREVLLDAFLPKVRLNVTGENVDPATCFSVPVKSVWLEIGFGGGEHLAEQSARRPDTGFIGAEVFVNGVSSLLTHLTGLNVFCNNVKAFNDDLLLLGRNLKDLTLLTLVLTGKDNNSVACFNV